MRSARAVRATDADAPGSEWLAGNIRRGAEGCYPNRHSGERKPEKWTRSAQNLPS